MPQRLSSRVPVLRRHRRMHLIKRHLVKIPQDHVDGPFLPGAPPSRRHPHAHRGVGFLRRRLAPRFPPSHPPRMTGQIVERRFQRTQLPQQRFAVRRLIVMAMSGVAEMVFMPPSPRLPGVPPKFRPLRERKPVDTPALRIDDPRIDPEAGLKGRWSKGAEPRITDLGSGMPWDRPPPRRPRPPMTISWMPDSAG